MSALPQKNALSMLMHGGDRKKEQQAHGAKPDSLVRPSNIGDSKNLNVSNAANMPTAEERTSAKSNVECPVCTVVLPESMINAHLDSHFGHDKTNSHGASTACSSIAVAAVDKSLEPDVCGGRTLLKVHIVQ